MEIKINKVEKAEESVETIGNGQQVAAPEVVPEAVPASNTQEPESFIKKEEESRPKMFANKKANVGLFICGGVVLLMLFAALIIRFAF